MPAMPPMDGDMSGMPKYGKRMSDLKGDNEHT